MTYTGDCLDVLRTLADNSVDSIVTDPPYELGFMGKHWDNTGIAYKVELWRECLRVLKPGGHLLSFGGSRTYHRMACAIEDAGFEIRDMVEWVYGSGFPKSLNIGKAIDKINGIPSENKSSFSGVSKTRDNTKNILRYKKCDDCGKLLFSPDPCKCDWRFKKADNDWQGFGTALKPAHEPVCLARKPLSEKSVAENVLKWGTGGIAIDKCRVEHNEPIKIMKAQDGGNKVYAQSGRYTETTELKSNGRFPANLCHDGSDEVLAVFPQTKSGALNEGHKRGKTEFYGGGIVQANYGNDSGSASRFFYCAKASKSERNAGLEGFEEKECGTMDDDNYQWRDDVPNGRSTNKPKRTNFHPTVKPISLMRYLCRLITPPNGIVLDPFMGSGTTGCACALEGFKFIGIEREADYVKIAEARIDYWQKQQPEEDEQTELAL